MDKRLEIVRDVLFPLLVAVERTVPVPLKLVDEASMRYPWAPPEGAVQFKAALDVKIETKETPVGILGKDDVAFRTV